jgi:hypothetical protein
MQVRLVHGLFLTKKFQLHLRSFDVVHSKTIGLICTAQDDSRIFVNEESNAKPTN